MNPLGKKFISLFLVFSLIVLPTSLYAKKRGAKLIVTKKDGQQIKGELITVKPNSLLLLNTEGKDESIDTANIRIIRIVKRSKIGKGAFYGLLIGVIGGGITGSRHKDLGIIRGAFIVSLVYTVPLGLLIGAIANAATRKVKKTFQIEGMTDSEIQETLDKLRKKARVPDYK